jgi:hypothetical protein
MPEISVNLKVAREIIQNGYLVRGEYGLIRGDSATDSPFYTIYRPVPGDAHQPNFLEFLFTTRTFPEPMRLGTIYFEADPDIFESRFAVKSVWTIVADEPIFAVELEELAKKLTLAFNPTKVYLYRISAKE